LKGGGSLTLVQEKAGQSLQQKKKQRTEKRAKKGGKKLPTASSRGGDCSVLSIGGG